MPSGPETFSEAGDIKKEEVIITPHAIERFIQHCREQKQLMPANFREAEMMIRNHLLKSSHKKAIGPVERVRALIDHKEETFYFRLGHWQFRIIRAPKNRNVFVLVTVVWLNERAYRNCSKSK